MVLITCLPCGCVRWYNTCPVGGCHRLYTPHICQWLCVLHNYCICTLLADGLPQHWGGNQDGNWIVQGGNTRSLHGQVSLTSVVHHTACKSHFHWLTTPTKTTNDDDDYDDDDDRYNSNNKTNKQTSNIFETVRSGKPAKWMPPLPPNIFFLCMCSLTFTDCFVSVIYIWTPFEVLSVMLFQKK